MTTLFRRPAPLFDPTYTSSGPPTLPIPKLDAVLGPLLQQAQPSRRRPAPMSAAAVFFASVPLLLAVLLVAHWSGIGFGGGDPTIRVTPSTPLDRCEADLRAEYDRWVADPDPAHVVNPSSCDQPAVSYQDYVRLFEAAAGGPVWTAAPQPTRLPEVQP